MRRRLITRAEFATLAGVKRPSITKACNAKLAPACVRQKIDVDHPAAVEYLRAHGAEPPPLPPPKPKKQAKRSARGEPTVQSSPRDDADTEPGDSPTGHALPVGVGEVDAEFFAEMTLDRIAREYGTMAEFQSVLDAAKTTAIIREKDDKHRKIEGSVVTRELVVVAVMGALEKLHRRLAKPVPTTIIRRAFAMARAGSTALEGEAMARELMTAELKAVRDSIARTLRDA